LLLKKPTGTKAERRCNFYQAFFWVVANTKRRIIFVAGIFDSPAKEVHFKESFDTSTGSIIAKFQAVGDASAK
jgi:hypothetical protein